MHIDDVTMYPIRITLTNPFRISVGEVQHKECVIFEVRSGDAIGWGEAAVDGVPFYTSETVGSVLDVARRVLIPLMKEQRWNSPNALADAFMSVRGNCFAKAGLDAAMWDLWGKQQGQPSWKLLGGTREQVEAGPSIGIQDTPAKTVEVVRGQLERGMRRIKLKVCPGFDTAYIQAVREAIPDIMLMVDANNAYTPSDFETIASWDRYNLLMIEQPLDENDIYFHAQLRKVTKTPICLDESIHTLHDARCATELGAVDIINIKVGRVGGLTQAKRIHDHCQSCGVTNWIGSRIGTGVAEAMRLAAASLPNCLLPSDLGSGFDYMADDILATPLPRTDGCFFHQTQEPGLGIEVDREKLAFYTEQQ